MIEIELTQGYTTVIDDEDWDLVSGYKWRAHKTKNTVYAKTQLPKVNGGKQIGLFMHRLLLNAQPGQFVDHKNGDGLDNQRENIRLCTNRENHQNIHFGWGKSKYKGVSWFERTKKWTVHIQNNGVQINLGYFNTEEEAALAYNKAALELFGEFASLNFITPDFGESIGIE